MADFDPNSYLRTNADVAAAAANSGMSAADFARWHWQNHGQAEGRSLGSTPPAQTQSRPISAPVASSPAPSTLAQQTLPTGFDPRLYKQLNADVAGAALNSQKSPEEFARWHWENFGQAEGRRTSLEGMNTNVPGFHLHDWRTSGNAFNQNQYFASGRDAAANIRPTGNTEAAQQIWSQFQNDPMAMRLQMGRLGVTAGDLAQVAGADPRGMQAFAGQSLSPAITRYASLQDVQQRLDNPVNNGPFTVGPGTPRGSGVSTPGSNAGSTPATRPPQTGVPSGGWQGGFPGSAPGTGTGTPSAGLPGAIPPWMLPFNAPTSFAQFPTMQRQPFGLQAPGFGGSQPQPRVGGVFGGFTPNGPLGNATLHGGGLGGFRGMGGLGGFSAFGGMGGGLASLFGGPQWR